VADVHPVWLHVVVAVVPVLLGLAAALLGYRRWQRVDDAVRSGITLDADRELRLVAVAVAAIAVIAGAAAVVGIFSR
ncbi:MAG: hypothetical protein QOD37_2175, partial [Gaiellales bacterium]|nr:hypothetical protein [Gaiellales bacterium]